MKSIFFFGFALVALLSACNTGNNKTTDAKQSQVQQDQSTTKHEQATVDTGAKIITGFPIREITTGYLQLKNALANDNGKEAAAAGNAIVTTLGTVNKASLSAEQEKAFADLQDDMKEHGEHIAANAGKIEHQREHFIMLSKDLGDLINSFGNGGQTLYKDFCPMANNGKGATWISEMKEIRNPYLGSKMPTCGSVKETIK